MARRIRAWVAFAAGSLALLCAVSTLGSGEPWLSRPPLVTGLFLLAFPVVGWVVIERSNKDQPSPPPVVWLVAGPLAVFLMSLGGSSLAGLQGAPHEENGHYYSNNHGVHTPLTRDEYLHDKALEQRGFASAAAFFYVGALFFTWSDLTLPRRRTQPSAV